AAISLMRASNADESSAAIELGTTIARREAEQQLLDVGAEIQQALRSYAGLAPTSIGAPGFHGPRSLEELLKDARTPGVRRHLRKLYADPLTGKPEWGLVTDSEGFILGVYSRADGKPIKQNGFDPRFASFEKADTYHQWVFGLPIVQRVHERR
ncbi:hypothetical protein LDP08_24995, partial [Ralstonia pseudosolanacearum]|uniref:hypothetical protein n=1 Tax=Ralstonia pseudosolanacearum TaxID=1310165 RepID=UPI003CFA4E43